MAPNGKPGVVLLMPQAFGDALAEPANALGYGNVACVNSGDGLLAAFEGSSPRLLLAFATGVIVPEAILASPGLLAVNVHGAPPSYPGRDPHHFAAYDGASSFGATLHRMVRAVDQGPVLRVSVEPVPPLSSPSELMAIGVRHGLALAREFLAGLAAGKAPTPDPRLGWSGPVRRRSDFLRLCRIEPGISREEFERRLRATTVPGYRNLTIELHGRTFRIDPE